MEKIVIYGHSLCPMLPPVLGMLKSSGAEYEYINIHQDLAARQKVQAINAGNESVPTLIFPDGSTLTEPSGAVLAKKLGAMGYRVPVLAWLSAYSFQILMVICVIWAVVSAMV